MPAPRPRRPISATEIAVWVYAIVEAAAITAVLWLR